MLTTYTS